MEYYTAVKEKDLFPFGTAWRDLESIMLSEISQSEKDKYNLKKKELELGPSDSPLIWSLCHHLLSGGVKTSAMKYSAS